MQLSMYLPSSVLCTVGGAASVRAAAFFDFGVFDLKEIVKMY